MSETHETAAPGAVPGSAPIRLFPSDVLEFFTHVHPAVVPAVWVPVAAAFLVPSFRTAPAAGHAWAVAFAFVAGLVLWTAAEYFLHRFIFHYQPRSVLGKRISFLMHGVHHAQPRVKTRLVMPLMVSIPLAVAFWLLFSLVFSTVLGSAWLTGPIFSGFVIGYVCYDLTHYTLHHVQFKGGIGKFLRAHHMRHHTEWESRFGVSTPLWDYVMGTEPPSDPSAKKPHTA
jgi:sterol desaturase/sphingolipid hydroxylase (fatty acid hydroxylase superfamily)